MDDFKVVINLESIFLTKTVNYGLQYPHMWYYYTASNYIHSL